MKGYFEPHQMLDALLEKNGYHRAEPAEPMISKDLIKEIKAIDKKLGPWKRFPKLSLAGKAANLLEKDVSSIAKLTFEDGKRFLMYLETFWEQKMDAEEAAK